MQSKDFQWFLKNYDELFKKYGKAFIAIKDENVIGVYDSYAEGVYQTSLKEKIGTFIVQECNGSDSAYTNYISSMNFC